MARPIKTRKPKGSVANALSANSFLHAHVKPGKQALKEPEKVVCIPVDFVTDSIALDDEAYADTKSSDRSKRWDYWVGTDDPSKAVVGIEVHPATPGEVKNLIEKKKWAEAKAETEVDGGKKTIRAWYWIASGKSAISPTTTESKQLVQAGIIFAGGCLRLPK